MVNKNIVWYCFILVLIFHRSEAQIPFPSLHYYLPEIEYDQSIPTPEKYFGFQVGEWHLDHDKVVSYFKTLDALSERLEIAEYGKTHEKRSLIVAMISSPKNMKDKEKIKKYNEELSLGKAGIDLKMPLVLSQGHSIHGNELSGMHASVLAAYYLVAGKSKEVEKIIDNLFILLDPSLNPDGSQRFSTWVNSHKSENAVTDPQSREFSETWPGGRYNHYWSDLNRDWLFLVHPESRGRIRLLKEWNPSVLGDHHEMGTNNTYFFQPGVPSQNNPDTPEQNFELTEEISAFHAKAFDALGSLYYTKYNFDDYYYGKGSTYSDAIGAIGILFEQASSRGHAQASSRGILTFPFTIRNQLTTSLSTYEGMIALKEKLMTYKKNFLQEVHKKLDAEEVKGYVFTDADTEKLKKFLHILLQHGIEVYKADKTEKINNTLFNKESSYIVPLKQKKPILAKTIFEEVTDFKDSLFYDISGWTVTKAYGLTVEPLQSVEYNPDNLVIQLPAEGIKSGRYNDKTYAYLIRSGQYNLYASLYALQQRNIKTLVSHLDIPYDENDFSIVFPKGSIVIPVQLQTVSKDKLYEILHEISARNNVEIVAVQSGNSTSVSTLGHPLIIPLEKPEAAFIAGGGISPQSAGEIWFHFDQDLKMPATILDITSFSSATLNAYNTLILPSGSYNRMSESDINKLKEWVKNGNTLISIGNATRFLHSQKFISLKPKVKKTKNKPSGLYSEFTKENNSISINGTIFSIDIDKGHPLFFGFDTDKTYLLKADTLLYEPATNAYATPAKFSQNYLVSGYHAKQFSDIVPGSAAVTTHSSGRGKIICFHDNVLFRNYWIVGANMFNNALFFGNTIAPGTMERAE
jgi:hypothetical protein